MKIFKNQKLPVPIVVFAGAAALVALAAQARADSAVDALLNKLEQKGILSVDEARELKAENDKSSAEDFNKEFNSKIQMPDWVTSYKLYGDFRGRYDKQSVDIPASNFGGPNSSVNQNNDQFRYRIRVGLIVSMLDDLEAGFRVASGTGSPLSENQTLNGNGSKKSLYVDAAYGKWTAITNDTLIVAGTIGKMDLPFQASPMVFDPDYTPEGAALQSNYKITDHHSVALNGGAFVIDQVNSRGPYLFGGQIIWNAVWTRKIGTSLGIAGYNIANQRNMKTYPNPSTGPYDSNLGNTRNVTNGLPLYNFNPIVVSGSATYTLDHFPLYPGAFPVKAAGEYINNPAAPQNNEGWWAGFTLGKSGKKGTWDISYRYQQLAADAWWDQLVDDDNIALNPNIPIVLPTETGTVAGGTNIKGSLVKFDYSILDSLMFSFTCYINELMVNPVPGTKTDAVHAMADLMWKF
jgi:hypothetical protein